MSSVTNFMKIEKVSYGTELIQWRRRMQAFRRQEDLTLRCYKYTPPIQDVEKFKEYQLPNSRAKSFIVLCLGYTALAKIHTFTSTSNLSLQRPYGRSLVVSTRHHRSKQLWTYNQCLKYHFSKKTRILTSTCPHYCPLRTSLEAWTRPPRKRERLLNYCELFPHILCFANGIFAGVPFCRGLG